MANRDTLRDLQSRLAARLQMAQTEGISVSWLAIEAGSKKYLLPLGESGEIFSWTTVQQVPYTQNWFLGVANLRGGLYGVVDLAIFLSHIQKENIPLTRTDIQLAACSLLALNPLLDTNTVLIADQLLGLRSADVFINTLLPAKDAPSFFGKIYIDSQNQEWQEIILSQLVQEKDFLNIGI